MEPLHLFFHVILYTKTNRVLLITHKALTSEPVEDFPWFDHSKNNNKKIIQQYYHMFRFIIQRDLTFEPMAKILWCDHAKWTSSPLFYKVLFDFSHSRE